MVPWKTGLMMVLFYPNVGKNHWRWCRLKPIWTGDLTGSAWLDIKPDRKSPPFMPIDPSQHLYILRWPQCIILSSENLYILIKPLDIILSSLHPERAPVYNPFIPTPWDGPIHHTYILRWSQLIIPSSLYPKRVPFIIPTSLHPYILRGLKFITPFIRTSSEGARISFLPPYILRGSHYIMHSYF